MLVNDRGKKYVSKGARYIWAFPNSLIGLAFVPFTALTRGGIEVVDGVLEVHSPFVAWVLQHCMPISGGATAITFGHVVLGRDRASLSQTRLHERVHVRQYERWGPLFLPIYLVSALWPGTHWMETQADRWAETTARDPSRPV